MKILVAGWDSGGGVEAVQTVVRRAAARGHQVRVLGTEGLRDRFESAGASFRVYRYAPDNDCRSAETDIIKEWEARTPLGVFARVRDRVMVGPGPEFGLAPVHSLADVIGAASRVLVCTSPSYDFGAGTVPGYVRYVGPQLADTSTGTWDDPGGPPLVLVGLSSTVMSHEEELLQRAA